MTTKAKPVTMTTIRKRVNACFTGVPCLFCQIVALKTAKPIYLKTLRHHLDTGAVTGFGQALKSRIIVALHVTKSHKALQRFLAYCDVVDIVKALQILDRPRRIRQLEKKITFIEEAHPHLKQENNDDDYNHCHHPRKKQKIFKLRKQLHVCKEQQKYLLTDHPCIAGHRKNIGSITELLQSSSVSGALSKKVRQWAQTNLTTDFLEFVLLSMPLDKWRTLADLVHFRPSDFPLPYFLHAIHGEQISKDSFISKLKEILDDANCSSHDFCTRLQVLAGEYPQLYQMYQYLRSDPKFCLYTETASLFARNIPIGTAVWYLEELAKASKLVPDIIAKRLVKGEWMKFKDSTNTMESFAKLVERILTCQTHGWNKVADALKDVAQDRLEALKAIWSSSGTASKSDEKVTVVFGDASSSMQSAIEAATILATMVSVCLDAELSLFHSKQLMSPYSRPNSVEQTLEICRTICANGCTSLAAALWPYYAKKQKLDRIVLVTDEYENTNFKGYSFAKLLHKYKKEIHSDVELLIISVGRGDFVFRQSLKAAKIKFQRIEIDNTRPDLTKFDSLLGQLGIKGHLLDDDYDIASTFDFSSVSANKQTDSDGDFVML